MAKHLVRCEALDQFFGGGNMMNLEPVALADSWEECPGFFVFRGPKGITQTLDLSPQYLETVQRKTHLEAAVFTVHPKAGNDDCVISPAHRQID